MATSRRLGAGGQLAARTGEMQLVRDGAPAYSLTPAIIGESAAWTRVMAVATRVAQGRAKVLITGESGVGKDILARAIHSRSERAAHRFVALNCASFSETLLESELFGHVKGSFTGAFRDKIGKLQQAHRGTIFLDEIAEMSLRMQALLLRFLENGEIQPVGSDLPPTRVDVRVVSATNRDLPGLVARGEFREDLLYRIKVAHLQVPPLRERVEDIRPLVAHVLAQTGRALIISDDALAILERYRWPGNVRELQNVVEQMVSTAPGTLIGIDDLPAAITASQGGHVYQRTERRRRVSDELYDELVAGRYDFWDDIHGLFTSRDITRADLRQLVRHGLTTTAGSYRGLLQLFGMDQGDYKKLMNFLAAHDCGVDPREFKPGATEASSSQLRQRRTSGARG
jgi:transcriptional regulator with PAS, ATPase and Fis domain